MKRKKMILTGTVVLLAILAVTLKYWDYLNNPWTRNGQVRAQVIKITPRVSGPIVNLPIDNNQFVKTGDLLFEIDPSVFKSELDQAKANAATYNENIKQAKMQLDQANAHLKFTESNYKRYKEMLASGATSQKLYDMTFAEYKIDLSKIESTKAKLQGAKSSLDQAKAQLESAELNLRFTKVKAPVDGYVTNLNLRLGSQAVANQPCLALVDVNSYWIDGFFKENEIANIKPGDKAIVTLMTYPDTPITGQVDSIGWGIAQDDGSTGEDLLPNVNPTFEWIRLAQRVPVSVHLNDLPKGVELRVGSTASVLVKTGTNDTKD